MPPQRQPITLSQPFSFGVITCGQEAQLCSNDYHTTLSGGCIRSVGHPHGEKPDEGCQFTLACQSQGNIILPNPIWSVHLSSPNWTRVDPCWPGARLSHDYTAGVERVNQPPLATTCPSILTLSTTLKSSTQRLFEIQMLPPQCPTDVYKVILHGPLTRIIHFIKPCVVIISRKFEESIVLCPTCSPSDRGNPPSCTHFKMLSNSKNNQSHQCLNYSWVSYLNVLDTMWTFLWCKTVTCQLE